MFAEQHIHSILLMEMNLGEFLTILVCCIIANNLHCSYFQFWKYDSLEEVEFHLYLKW